MVKGRPKTFEDAEVLEKAKEIFWEKGYDATTLNDLIDGMGISRQSMYNTFGNKHNLFVSCLECYIKDLHDKISHLLQSPKLSTKEKVLHLIDFIQSITDGENAPGCMLSSTITELAQKDDKVRKILDQKYIEKFTILESFFQLSLDHNEISSRLTAKDLAHLFDSIVLSSTALCKLPNRCEQIENLKKIFLMQIEFH